MSLAAAQPIDAWLATVSSSTPDLGATVRYPSVAVAPTQAGPSVPPRLSESVRGALQRLPRIPLGLGDERAGADADLELGEVLGEGGMGRVHVARQRSLDREVAVKLLRADDADALGSLLREARLMGSLEHPGILPVHALGVDASGRPVLVMKRLEGTSLQDLLDDPGHRAWGALASSGDDRTLKRLEIVMQVCSALAFAHDRGIVHRDVKPANVLVGRFGEVYLADWGIALDLSRLEEEPELPVGTPAFLAPEMVLGDPRDVDARTDVYLLGATLHAVLVGAPPHAGHTLSEALEHALASPLIAYPPEVPRELAALMNQAMRASRDERPPSALAFRDAIAQYLHHRGAVSLAERAEERLREAKGLIASSTDDPQRVRARVHLGEARFGFSQALEQWAGCEAARAGLGEAVEAAVALELEDGAVGAARALLEGLPEPRPDLQDQVERASRRLARAAREAEQLRADAREHDPRVSAGARTALIAALALTCVALAFGLRASRLGPDPYPELTTPLYPLVAALVVVPAALWRRTGLARSAVNRGIVLTIFVTLGLASAFRALAYVFRTPIDQVMTYELVLFATAYAVLGVFVARTFAAAAVVSLAAAGLAAWRPALLEVFYVSSPIALAIASYASRSVRELRGADAAPVTTRDGK